MRAFDEFKKDRSSMRKARVSVATFLGLFALVAVAAKADTYTFNTDHCSSACLPFTGTVTVTQNGANTVHVSVTGSGFGFVDTAGGGDEFFFNIIGDPVISIANLTSGWSLVSTSASSTDALGGGGWGFDYALTCGTNCGPGGSKPLSPPLSFDITATGLTPASFFDTDGAASPVQFAADVLANGNTGLVGATRTSTTVPEPISLSLVGGGLLALGLFRRRFSA